MLHPFRLRARLITYGQNNRSRQARRSISPDVPGRSRAGRRLSGWFTNHAGARGLRTAPGAMPRLRGLYRYVQEDHGTDGALFEGAACGGSDCDQDLMASCGIHDRLGLGSFTANSRREVTPLPARTRKQIRSEQRACALKLFLCGDPLIEREFRRAITKTTETGDGL